MKTWKQKNWDRWGIWKKIRHIIAVISSLTSVLIMFLLTIYIVLFIFGIPGFIMHMRDTILLEIMHSIFG
jgi:hypothetical protein